MSIERTTRAAVRTLALLAAGAAGLTAQDAGERAMLERVVFAAFPEADAFRCIGRDVDQAARRIVEGRLPFKVHFNELGEHRLLVAFRGRRPVGLVYRRVEESEWGLMEIAWHMTLDQRVVGLDFVRGRNAHITTMLRTAFAHDMVGKDLVGLRAMLDAVERDAAANADESRRGDGGLAALQRTTLRSALKALTVTDVVWRDEVGKLADQATGFDLFPAAARFVRRSTTFDLSSDDGRRAVDVKAVFAYDVAGTELGCVAWTSCLDAGKPIELRWVVDRDHRAVGLTATHEAPTLELRKGCSVMLGRPLAEPAAVVAPLPSLSRGLAAALPQLVARRVAR
ncbi:MAG: hypothetical protein R3F29_12900 [Planctomycetota bacterium]